MKTVSHDIKRTAVINLVVTDKASDWNSSELVERQQVSTAFIMVIPIFTDCSRRAMLSLYQVDIGILQQVCNDLQMP